MTTYRDFYSDINLSIEILNRDDLLSNISILIAGFGSAFFVLIPYVANLVIASRIKEIIKENEAAKGWFQYHTPVFTVLVVLSGGVYVALSVVASNIFGLRIFSCGLTQYELKKLNKLKVIGTVMIENVPQLICQAIYTVALIRTQGKTTTAVQLAFVASSLSIIASTLTYMIERDASDTKVIQYHITTHRIPTTDTINDYEKKKIKDNRGRARALGEGIAEVFGIAAKNIEVGSSMITKHGVITHIVHYLYDEDLETMQQELVDNQIMVTPKYFVSQLFATLKEDINDLFCNHFTLDNDFEVTLDVKLGIESRIKKTLRSFPTVPPALNMVNSQSQSRSPKSYNRRAAILQNVVRTATLQSIQSIPPAQQRVANTGTQAKSECIRAIEAYCNHQGINDDDQKQQAIINLMKSMNTMKSLMLDYAIHGIEEERDIEGMHGSTTDVLRRAITASNTTALAFAIAAPANTSSDED